MESFQDFLQDFKDKMAKDYFGVSLNEAFEKGICINCKELALPKCYSDAGRREYKISGLCETCFDYITLVVDEEFTAKIKS